VAAHELGEIAAKNMQFLTIGRARDIFALALLERCQAHLCAVSDPPWLGAIQVDGLGIDAVMQ
jgi:hypothetical protein